VNTTTTAYQVVAQDDAGPPRELSGQDLQIIQANGGFPGINGWKVTQGYRVELAVILTSDDGSGATLDTNIPTLHVQLASGGQTIELQVADLRGAAARAWGDALLREGEDRIQAFPLGQGFVKGATALIDQGDRLVWATYNDGGDAQSLSANQATARLMKFQVRVGELVSKLRDGRSS